MKCSCKCHLDGMAHCVSCSIAHNLQEAIQMTDEIEKIRDRDSGFRFGCPECPQHFVTKESMMWHLQNDHSGDSPSYHLGDSDFRNGGSIR